MIRSGILVLGLAFVSTSSAWAIPQTLNFQGLLKEAGSPVTGSRDITIKIYSVPTEGTSLLTEAHAGSTVTTGVFNVIVGDLTSGGIPLGIFNGEDRYIGVTIGTGAELAPRQKITSVGNAFFAATAANLTPGATIQIASLDVTGGVQFGAGATKSTFTATGDLTLSSNADLTLTGSAAYATFPASVTASAFFGDGSHLSGITSGTDKYVKMIAQTILTTDFALSSSSVRICVAGSSVTATSSACKIKAVVTGSLRSNTGGGECYLAILEDQDWLPGWTASKPMAYARTVGGAEALYTPAIINYTGRTATTAASHTWCIALWTNGTGTCTLESGEANANFEIWEVCD